MAISFKVIYLETNQGHGNARRISVDNATNELVALMDADDISSPFRFQKQLELFASIPNLDVCGGNITEFVGDETNITGRRIVKETDAEIKRDLKKRCPMNQVTVMFKKQAYNLAGGYIDWYCEEDYYLWTRMIEKGCVFGNVPDDIVNVRTGLEMSARRGGWKYFKSERRLQRYLLKKKLISFPRYIYNVLLRFGGEVLLPNFIRNRAFKTTRARFEPSDNILEPAKWNVTYLPFTVSMCVYGKDNAEWFEKALSSILIKQTTKPSELVLVVDGLVPSDIQNVIEKYSNICSI